MSTVRDSGDAAASERKERESTDELHQPVWSVISFDRHESAGMSYDQAVQKLAELETKGAAGLCVVTDDAAARMGKN